MRLAIAAAALAAFTASASANSEIVVGKDTPLYTMFCVEADPAITLMQRLVKGDPLTPSDYGSMCALYAERAIVETVHSRQDDPFGHTWTLASVRLPNDRVGYILTSLSVVEGMEI
ncbi:hypothetical protein [Mesorhizobium sp. Z1-4]|uniref:hypothetical protein n=1 Tax=Mesorhizobium sp. Z1-4 TaxID=2448478 RepID=UPI000FD7BD75|nr:hypothetical protein [Mesorhizobium sp. Z1-4]